MVGGPESGSCSCVLRISRARTTQTRHPKPLVVADAVREAIISTYHFTCPANRPFHPQKPILRDSVDFLPYFPFTLDGEALVKNLECALRGAGLLSGLTNPCSSPAAPVRLRLHQDPPGQNWKRWPPGCRKLTSPPESGKLMISRNAKVTNANLFGTPSFLWTLGHRPVEPPFPSTGRHLGSVQPATTVRKERRRSRRGRPPQRHSHQSRHPAVQQVLSRSFGAPE